MSGHGTENSGFEVVVVFATNEKIVVQESIKGAKQFDISIEVDPTKVVKGIDPDVIGCEGIFSGCDGLL